jgi:hypothetical protein
MNNAAEVLSKQIDSIGSPNAFCTDWKTQWRGVAVAAQGILNTFFPLGAKVLGFLITIADNFCATTTAKP